MTATSHIICDALNVLACIVDLHGDQPEGTVSSPIGSPRRNLDKGRLDLFEDQDSGDEQRERRSVGLAETAGDVLSIKMVSAVSLRAFYSCIISICSALACRPQVYIRQICCG